MLLPLKTQFYPRMCVRRHKYGELAEQCSHSKAYGAWWRFDQAALISGHVLLTTESSGRSGCVTRPLDAERALKNNARADRRLVTVLSGQLLSADVWARLFDRSVADSSTKPPRCALAGYEWRYSARRSWDRVRKLGRFWQLFTAKRLGRAFPISPSTQTKRVCKAIDAY